MNSEGFRETLSEERQKEPRKAKMAGREEAAERAEGPRDLGSEMIEERPKVTWKRQETSRLCIRERESKAGRA